MRRRSCSERRLGSASSPPGPRSRWRRSPICMAGHYSSATRGGAASLAATGAHAVQFFADGFAPGDAAVSNDPFVGAWHVTDFTVVRRAIGASRSRG